jgi:hypothetical protein
VAGTKAITTGGTAEAPKKYKVKLEIKKGYSTITRGNGLPLIDDQTDKAVKWLAKKEYKPEEIEIIGEKPSIWDTVFNISK